MHVPTRNWPTTAKSRCIIHSPFLYDVPPSFILSTCPTTNRSGRIRRSDFHFAKLSVNHAAGEGSFLVSHNPAKVVDCDDHHNTVSPANSAGTDFKGYDCLLDDSVPATLATTPERMLKDTQTNVEPLWKFAEDTAGDKGATPRRD